MGSSNQEPNWGKEIAELMKKIRDLQGKVEVTALGEKEKKCIARCLAHAKNENAPSTIISFMQNFLTIWGGAC